MTPYAVAVVAALQRTDEETIQRSPIHRYIILLDRLIRESQELPPEVLEHVKVGERVIGARIALACMTPAPVKLGDFLIRSLTRYMLDSEVSFRPLVTDMTYSGAVFAVFKNHRELWDELATELGLEP